MKKDPNPQAVKLNQQIEKGSMAISYSQQIEVANDPAFINRVQQAAVQTALAVSAEASSAKAGVDSARLTFATQVLRDPQKYARLLAYGAVADGSLSLGSSDAQIAGRLSAIWNAYAGVNPNL